ncbi:MAG: hypothetical protein FWB96_11485 [Defluviitaleaceae bacterium]|nr:hypothetical protein [Defluviitaleaceae bacterium]MCL2263685.1 hypothetical protein [Defluviitaleaceae bacterium]
MDKKILPTTLLLSLAEQIHTHIPEIIIVRPSKIEGFVEETRKLLVFTDSGGKDTKTDKIHLPNSAESYPHIFIENLTPFRSIGRERRGRRERFNYRDLFRFEFNIDMKPLDRQCVPRLNEALYDMAQKLSRVLQYIPYFDAVKKTLPATPPAISDGILHTFLEIEYNESDLPVEHEKVQQLFQRIKLRDDEVM